MAASLDDRPEFVREVDSRVRSQVEVPISMWAKVSRHSGFRKILVLVAIALAWQWYAVAIDNQLLFPTFTDMLTAFASGISSGTIPDRAWGSLKVLLVGYALGMVLAGILTALAISTSIGNDILEVLTSMFNPLPAIALLPLALIWFGLGNGSLIFVLVHSVVWPVALNTHSGFRAVSPTVRMVGRNYGLTGTRYVWKILVPAALPSILTGMKIGWAFAWRTLIAAELVFGVSSGSGGLGWFIYQKKNELDIASVFAGLFSVILIGLLVENVIFRVLARKTVQRWGMQT